MCLIRWLLATVIFLLGLVALAIAPGLVVLILLALICIPWIVRKLGG